MAELTADDLLTRGVSLDEPLELEWAAVISGIAPATIRQWKRRGKLAPADYDEFNRPMYRPIDVMRVEAQTRRLRSVG